MVQQSSSLLWRKRREKEKRLMIATYSALEWSGWRVLLRVKVKYGFRVYFILFIKADSSIKNKSHFNNGKRQKIE